MLTYQDVKDLVEYNPVTGEIKWQSSGRGRKLDRAVGNINKQLGYFEVRINGHRTYGHRLAWLLTYGEMPKGQIDHVNGIRHDNRLVNLRVVDNQENHKNMKKHKGNRSGVTGVYWSKKAKKWQSYICVGGKQIYPGVYEYLVDAETARKEAEIEYGFHKNHGRKT